MIAKALLFVIAKTWKPPQCPSTDEWRNKLWHIHMMKCYSAIKRSKLIHTTHISTIMLGERSQSPPTPPPPKSICCKISFLQNSRKCKPISSHRKQISRCLGWRGRSEELQNTRKSLGITNMFHILLVVMISWLLKLTKLYTFKRVLYVNYTSIKALRN